MPAKRKRKLQDLKTDLFYARETAEDALEKKNNKVKTAAKKVGKAAKFAGRAAANPYLAAAMFILEGSDTQGEEHDEAVRARNEAWARKKGWKQDIIPLPVKGLKNYARGGGVRKTRMTDY